MGIKRHKNFELLINLQSSTSVSPSMQVAERVRRLSEISTVTTLPTTRGVSPMNEMDNGPKEGKEQG